jgi:hypothetical protein
MERFPAKACPALDAGWIPVRMKKTRQNQIKEIKPPARSEKAPAFRRGLSIAAVPERDYLERD